MKKFVLDHFDEGFQYTFVCKSDPTTLTLRLIDYVGPRSWISLGVSAPGPTRYSYFIHDETGKFVAYSYGLGSQYEVLNNLVKVGHWYPKK